MSRKLRIFVNYRREDTSGHAGRLYDALAGRFGDDSVFMDVDKIDPGVDFKQVINAEVGSCDVLIALIGRSWSGATDSEGLRRLDDPQDYVRLEIEAALQRGIRVIPALVEGASMPTPRDLPLELATLSDRHSIELGDGVRWRQDVERLLEALERIRAEKELHARAAPMLGAQESVREGERVGPGRPSATEPAVSGALAPSITSAAPGSPSQEAASARQLEPGSRGSSQTSRWLIAAFVAAIAVATALAIVLVTRDSGGSPAAATSSTAFHVVLSSSAEVPSSLSSTSSGTADITIGDTRVCWDFRLTGVDNPTFAHIHQGGSNVSGPVFVPLSSAYKPTGCTTTTAVATKAMLASPSAYYVNVHTAKYPDGAVRGQLERASAGPTGTTKHSVGLPGIVPNDIFKGCALQAHPAAGAVQTAVCGPSPASGNVFYPDRIELSTFATTAALMRAYNAAREDAGVGTDFGRCDGVSWAGEAPWLHAPAAPGQAGKPGGRRFCYFDGNFAVIVWAHEKFGQTTHVDFLGIAREGGSDHARLFSWWRFWTHRMGKCQQEGCTATVK